MAIRIGPFAILVVILGVSGGCDEGTSENRHGVGGREVLLRLHEGDNRYTASGLAFKFKLTHDGQLVYEPTRLQCPVEAQFRGKNYQAVFDGELLAEAPATDPTLAPSITFRGQVSGVFVVDGLVWKPGIPGVPASDCTVLDQDSGGRFLVKGKAQFLDCPLVVGPSAKVKNLSKDRQPIILIDSHSDEHMVAFDDVAILDGSGQLGIGSF